MRLRVTLFLLIGFLISTAQADTIIEVRGRITLLGGNMPPIVEIHAYAESGVDVTSVVSNGIFKLKVPMTGATQYNLRVPGTSYDMMLSLPRKNLFLAITLDKDRMKDVHVEKSRENEAYKLYAGTVTAYDEKLRKLFIVCEKDGNCEKELNGILTDYKVAMDGLRDKYKGTYTADVLCKMKTPVVAKEIRNTASEFRAGYFDGVPFADDHILTNSVYKDMINAYVDFVIELKYSKEEIFIKDLMGKAKADPLVYSRTAGILYEALFNKSREKMLGMFITWYNENKAAVNNPVVDIKVANIMKTMPGGQYLDIVRTDVAGKDVSLKDVVSHANCTMLLFWASDCSHCREEMPQIKEMYAKYHPKGLDIFAVSLERDHDQWKKYIADNGLTWTNVNNLYDVRADNPAMQYMVAATPTMVLIDKSGTIVHRFTPKNKLDKYLSEILK